MQLRTLRRAGGALLAAPLLLACSGDDATTTTTSTTTTTTTTTTTEAAGGTSDDEVEGGIDTTEPTAGSVIEVSVVGGDVEGGGRREVALGDTVTIRVTSDTADEIHVHGYDVYGDVAAGRTGEVTFVADIPGVFEVELEDAGIQLVELQIS